MLLTGISLARAEDATNCVSIPNGAVAWWPGNGNVYDFIGTNNGTAAGGLLYQAGKVGNAFVFDGIDDGISIPASSSLNVQDLTFEAWVNPASQAKAMPLLEYANTNGLAGVHIWINGNGTGHLFANIRDTSGNQHALWTENGSLPANQWSHIAVTFNQTNGALRLYINGAVKTETMFGAFTPDTVKAVQLGMRPAFSSDGLNGACYQGMLDEPTLYDRVLSQEQIAAIYAAGGRGKCLQDQKPIILVQPASSTLLAGNNVTFSVTAEGALPLTYQWTWNGTNIDGATNSSLILTNIQVADAGAYAVVVRAGDGSTLSSNAVLTVVSPDLCVAAASGMVAWWPGSENVNDLAGTNNGAVSGGLLYEAGKVGKAFVFDGIDDGISIPSSPSLNAQDLTFEAWVNPASQTTAMPLLEYANANGSAGVHIWLNCNGTGRLFANIRDTLGGQHELGTDTDSLLANQWSHIAVTFNHTNGALCLYINGELKQETVFGAFDPDTTKDIQLGLRPAASTDGLNGARYTGMLDEPSLYNRVLSQEQIAAIYTAGSYGKCLGVQAPVILVQPENSTQTVGSNVTFSVTAEGSLPLAYQWTWNGANIVGATNSCLALTNVQMADAGFYAVAVWAGNAVTMSSNAVLTVVAPDLCAPVSSGLVSWWKGNGNANDFLGTNNGAVTGGLLYETGKVGRAFVFDGIDDGISIPASASLNVQDLTFEAWVNPASQTQAMPLLEYANSNGLAGVHIWINGNGTGHLFANIRDINGNQHALWTASGSLPSGQWSHIAVTFNHTDGALRIYINGDIKAESMYGAFTPDTSKAVQLGLRPASSADGLAGTHYVGMLDEPALFNRALSQEQIEAIYRADSYGKCLRDQPPILLTQPESSSLLIGSDVTFSVTAEGTIPFEYQWLWNSTNIAGATNASLTLTNIQLDNAGTYAVEVHNTAGSVMSSNAVLVVLTVPPCASITNGLVGWWAGEYNLADQMNLNPGDTNSVVQYATGKVNQAFLMDGLRSHVTIPASPALAVKSLTVEAWINPSDISSAMPIVEWSSANGLAGVHMWLATRPADGKPVDGTLFANIAGGSVYGGYANNPLASASGLVPSNQWSHVALTYDQASGIAQLYYNGASVVSNNVGQVSHNSSVAFNIGQRPPGSQSGLAGASFKGLLDEVSVYSRALDAGEILSIYKAGLSGKCPVALAPFLFSQPANQRVADGETATFSAGVGGTGPLSYQWLFQGVAVVGGTNATLVLTNAQSTMEGNYSVVVSNALGSVTSSAATLTLYYPPSRVQMLNSAGSASQPITVPIALYSRGNENALGFSVSYSRQLLTLVDVSLGNNALGGALMVNTNQSTNGRVGVMISLPAGQTFSKGSNEIVTLTFNASVVNYQQTAALNFGNQPTVCQMSDANAHELEAQFVGASVLVRQTDLEGDVTPRPVGDHVLGVTDWVQVGRFVARLDTPANASEFQRVDSAPRGTLGDGRITVADWVQAGRYAASLDPKTGVGGPSSEATVNPARTGRTLDHSMKLTSDTSSTLKVPDMAIPPGESRDITIQLEAQGNENALSFSLVMDPQKLKYLGVALAAGAKGATLNINTNDVPAGHVGIALALTAGKTIPAGTQDILQFKVQAIANAKTTASITLADTPVPRDMADALANVVSANYQNGTISIEELILLMRIARDGTNVVVAWPTNSYGYTLQLSDSLTNSQTWTNITSGVSTNEGEKIIKMPMDQSTRYYRLVK